MSSHSCKISATGASFQQQSCAGNSGAQRYLLGCANNVCALACSGQVIVSAEAGKLGLIRLWDAASGQCQALLHGDPSSAKSAPASLTNSSTQGMYNLNINH